LGELGEALGEWGRSHRAASLDEHEQQVLGLRRRVAAPLLGAVLAEALGLGEASQERLRSACPGCGTRRRRQSWRPREVATVCGAVRLRRPYYYCRPCRRGWCPADASLGLAPSQELSARLRAIAPSFPPAVTTAEFLEALAIADCGDRKEGRIADWGCTQSAIRPGPPDPPDPPNPTPSGYPARVPPGWVPRAGTPPQSVIAGDERR